MRNKLSDSDFELAWTLEGMDFYRLYADEHALPKLKLALRDLLVNQIPATRCWSVETGVNFEKFKGLAHKLHDQLFPKIGSVTYTSVEWHYGHKTIWAWIDGRHVKVESFRENNSQ